MTVIVLTNCPTGLRGLLTRWLLEIAAGVFVGDPSARVRDVLWEEVRGYKGQGRAIMAYTTNSEQGYTFRTFDHAWHPVDHEGLTLIQRPSEGSDGTGSSTLRSGWSNAAKRRRFGGR